MAQLNHSVACRGKQYALCTVSALLSSFSTFSWTICSQSFVLALWVLEILGLAGKRIIRLQLRATEKRHNAKRFDLYTQFSCLGWRATMFNKTISPPQTLTNTLKNERCVRVSECLYVCKCYGFIFIERTINEATNRTPKCSNQMRYISIVFHFGRHFLRLQQFDLSPFIILLSSTPSAVIHIFPLFSS